ncbi:BatA domain-containing protein [bacterium]|nr:BatA domain-containing protein [bacterium]MBU1983577.1 BatA domain-containing protein [bacterium]
MTFLNSAILAALTLGLLPILIHLLNRQRFKKVDFPTLRFLRELQRQKMRQVRLRQVILLILRTLAVLFLVVALARPVLKSSAGILPGANAKTTAVLILDRSASMQTETPDGSRFRSLQTRAQEILRLLKDGDEAVLIWADDPPQNFPPTPTAQIHVLREAVVNAAAGYRGGDLVAALRAARRILGQSQNLHKEVYVLSDFSGSAWPAELPSEPLMPDDVRLFLLSPDGARVRNVGITQADVTSRIITPGRPIEVTFTARNTGAHPAEDHIISVYLGGRRVAQTRITLSPGGITTERFKFVPDMPGDQVGYVRVEDADDLAADDQRYFVLRVPSQLRVALAGFDGAARALTALALNPTGDPGAFVNVRVLSESQLEMADWSEFDAIFLMDASDFSPAFGPRLRRFVENGRGVFVASGPRSDLRSYAAWLPSLGLPTPVELWQDTTGTRWSRVDMKHPLFEGLFEETPTNVSPDIYRLVRVADGSTAVEIVATAGNLPFLLESYVGHGHALLMAGSPDPEWSTLFRSGIFPPLMVSSAAYLSGIGTSGTMFQLTAGVAAQLAFPGAPGEEKYEVRGEENLIPTVETAGTGFDLRFPGLEMPGDYELWQGSRRVSALAVSVSAKETDIMPLPEQSYRKILGGRVVELGQQTTIQAAVFEGRHGLELWKLCLFIALGLLIAEALVGRVGKREVVAA